jgi:hypothetical protein
MVASRNPSDPPKPEGPDPVRILARNPTDPPAPVPPPPGEPQGPPAERGAT